MGGRVTKAGQSRLSHCPQEWCGISPKAQPPTERGRTQIHRLSTALRVMLRVKVSMSHSSPFPLRPNSSQSGSARNSVNWTRWQQPLRSIQKFYSSSGEDTIKPHRGEGEPPPLIKGTACPRHTGMEKVSRFQRLETQGWPPCPLNPCGGPGKPRLPARSPSRLSSVPGVLSAWFPV